MGVKLKTMDIHSIIFIMGRKRKRVAIIGVIVIETKLEKLFIVQEGKWKVAISFCSISDFHFIPYVFFLVLMSVVTFSSSFYMMKSIIIHVIVDLFKNMERLLTWNW